MNPSTALMTASLQPDGSRLIPATVGEMKIRIDDTMIIGPDGKPSYAVPTGDMLFEPSL